MKKAMIFSFVFCLTLALTYGKCLAVDLSGEPFSVEADPIQFLEEAVENIIYEADSPESTAPLEWTDADWYMMDSFLEYGDYEPPPGAGHHPGGEEAIPVPVDGEPRRMKRYMEKSPPQGGGDSTSAPQRKRELDDWRKLSFSSGSFTPGSGIDVDMAAEVPVLKAKGRHFVYGFILMDEYLTDETRKELEALGIAILGPHSQLYKAKFPADFNIIQHVSDLPYVEWVGYSLLEQKIGSDLQKGISGEIGFETPDDLPILINLFDDDPDGFFKGLLEDMGVIVGKYDPELRAYRAVASPGVINDIVILDFVLFVELIRQTTTGHNQSMASMGVDYLRPGGSGTNYNGSSTTLGVMDTGFMMGGAAPTMHQDLNKNGCGRNYTADAADVWNDQHGHGTHVLATICGTGTANDDFRGVAIGMGSSGTNRIRAAKIWDSMGNGNSSWMENAMDYFDDASDCSGESPRPQVINISGGQSGGVFSGTDSTSRKLDGKVWTYDQLYVVCGGNTGPGASTIWIPGVAKNALAVGNALDNGYLTVGDINNGSSRGPTADGRMKPNLIGAGTEVTSARAGTTNQYRDMSGCSMATPHVSGIAATLMQHYADFRWRPYLLRSFLMAASILHDDDTTPANNSSGGRNIYGLGRLSAYLAHWARNNSNGWTTHWTWGTVDNDTYIYRDITVPSGTDRLVIVLTWDEQAASAGASDAVIYDLDLWADLNADCSDPIGQCGQWASQSYEDNVEYLIINSPTAGTYRLKAVPWDAPSSGLPIGISAVIIRGDPTPLMSMSATPSTSTPMVGGTFTVTTTVSNPAYIASGVHLARTSISSGLTQISIQTTREDNINMNFGTASNFTFGNIHESDSRNATWTFRANSAGNKSISFRAWSENGGTVMRTVSVTPGSPPSTPGSISYPASDCDGTFTISWSAVSGATSYRLQRATSPSFSGAVSVYAGSGTSYTQSVLDIGTYYYRVRANNVYGNSSYRAGGSIVVSGPPSTPASITYPSSDSDGIFTVSWLSVSGVTGYTLQRATNSSFSGTTTVYSGSSTSYSQTGLDTGTYYYRIRANNSCGSSGWRTGGAISVCIAPSPPVSISYPSSDSDGIFTVSWLSVSGATGYTLQRATNSSFSGTTTVYSGSSTSYSQTGLGTGTYYYRVRANNSCGSSGWRTGGAINIAAPGILSVTPSEGLTSSGNEGGPFSPSNKTYTLENTGGSSISWTASKGQAWVTLSSNGGTLTSGASTIVTVSINNGANSLEPGSYSGTVGFANTTNGNGDTTIPVNLTVNGSVEVYTLSLSRTGNGSVRVNDTLHALPWSGQFSSGAQVQLEASPDSGWNFSSWSGDLTGSINLTTITMNSDKSVTAIFAESAAYDLTVKIVGSGYVKLDPDGGTYDSDTEVELTATADPGWVFSVWSGDLVSSDNPETIVMNSDKNVTAIFLEDSNTEIKAFVTRFYQLCLGRDPDPSGLNGWVSALLNGSKTGSDVAHGFVFSQEFIRKNTTAEEYITILYEAFFNRTPDSGGLKGWLDAIKNGASREDVLNGFIYAIEFAELCDEYDIKAFEGHITKAQKGAVEAFVTRFYQLCLGRDPDPAGLEGWTNNLLNQIQTGEDVANGFIYSQEFINKNTTNDQYLKILYKAFFNRDPDQGGWDVWIAELNAGKDRGYVLNGFLGSQEFIMLCEDYGITPF